MMVTVYAVLAVTVDALHALLMVLWVLGLPLLFWHRWPQVTMGYALFAIAFVVVNRVSFYVLDECFLTTINRALWTRAGHGMPDHMGDWFTVRFARLVFGLTPSQRWIKIASEVLILVTAAGMLSVVVWRRRRRDRSEA